MGIAAYNRGSQLISRQVRPSDSERQDEAMRAIRDRINACPKRAGRRYVTRDLRVWRERGVWHVQPVGCGSGDQSLWYPTLKAAMIDWPNHYLIGMEGGGWIAVHVPTA